MGEKRVPWPGAEDVLEDAVCGGDKWRSRIHCDCEVLSSVEMAIQPVKFILAFPLGRTRVSNSLAIMFSVSPLGGLFSGPVLEVGRFNPRLNIGEDEVRQGCKHANGQDNPCVSNLLWCAVVQISGGAGCIAIAKRRNETVDVYLKLERLKGRLRRSDCFLN